MILSAAGRAGGGGLIFASFFIGALIQIVAALKILPKAGYSRWFAILLLIPLVGPVMILVFAFSDWPLDKEVRAYRQAGGRPPGGISEPPWPTQPPGGYPPGGAGPQGGWQSPNYPGPPPTGGNSPPPWPGS